MTLIVDVFRFEASGPRWLEAAATLDGAKARVQELAAHSPGKYLLLDQKTGTKLVIKVDGANEQAR